MRMPRGRERGLSQDDPAREKSLQEDSSQDESSGEAQAGRTGSSRAGRSTGESAPGAPGFDLLHALDEYRAGHKGLEEAAQEAGVGSWDLLEAVQATPDPMVAGLDAAGGLQPFVRRRDD